MIRVGFPLAEYFLAKLCADAKMPEKYLMAPALSYLEKAVWAGNVRELQNVLERALIVSEPGRPVTLLRPLSGAGAILVAVSATFLFLRPNPRIA